MGMYDSIYFKCDCGEEIEAQSKSGSCSLERYWHDSVPSDVALNANRHAPFVCAKCGNKYAFNEIEVPDRVNLRVIKLL